MEDFEGEYTDVRSSAEELSLAFERDNRRYNRAFFEEDE